MPELRETYPGSNGQSRYPRTLHSSPSGPPSFPDSHGLVASSSMTTGRSARLNGTSSHTSHSSRSDANYSSESPDSGYSERRGPYASATGVGGSNSVSRGSPSLPSVRPHRPSSMGHSLDYRDPRGLPPIYPSAYGTESDPRRTGMLSYDGVPRGGSPPLRQPTLSYAGPQGYSAPYPNRNSYGGGGMSSNCAVSFDPTTEYGDGNKKRRRGNLPKNVTEILRAWFQDHIAHPYPTEEEKICLMRETGLSMSQVG